MNNKKEIFIKYINFVYKKRIFFLLYIFPKQHKKRISIHFQNIYVYIYNLQNK